MAPWNPDAPRPVRGFTSWLAILVLTAGCAGSPATTNVPESSLTASPSPSPSSGTTQRPEASSEPAATASWRSSDSLRARPLGETEAPLGYYEYLPPTYGDGDLSPLLVFLHGKDEFGDGSEPQLRRLMTDGGSIPLLIESDAWPANRPFVVLVPQHPGTANDELYAHCFEGPLPGDCALPIQTKLGHPEGNSICHRPVVVHEFIAYALDTYDIDPDRVYLTGLSCGGYAAFEYAAAYGGSQVAAMVPIAGEGRPAWDQVGCALGEVPIWAFHGDADNEVSPAGSVETLTNLADCPSADNHRLTLYPGGDHNSWTRTYDLSAGNDLYGWLLGFTRP